MGGVEMFDRYKTVGAYHNYFDTEHCGEVYQRAVLSRFGRLVQRRKQPPFLVADIASGLGEAAYYLERRFGFPVVRIDINQTALGLDEGPRTRALAEALPLKNSTLDGIHIKDAIVHIHNKLNLFKEFERVLKPGGVAAVVSQSIFLPYFTYLILDKPDELQYSFILLGQLDKTFRKLTQNQKVFEVSPPYFLTTYISTKVSAELSGLQLIDNIKWSLPPGEKDWHKNPKERFVLLFQKPL